MVAWGNTRKRNDDLLALEQRRNDVFWDLVAWLNDRGEIVGERLYDCGPLGYLLIRWDGMGWHGYWYIALPLPAELATWKS